MKITDRKELMAVALMLLCGCATISHLWQERDIITAELDALWQTAQSNITASVTNSLPATPDAPAYTNLPIIGAGTITGFGRVNEWWNNPSLLDAETTAMQKAGVRCYLIELSGNSKDKVLSDSGKQEQVKSAYRTLLGHCRAKGLYCLVAPCNNNMGLKKWGDPGIKLAEVLPAVKSLCDFIKAQGPENVLLQPVSETQDSAGVEIENYCRKNLSEFALVNNNAAGRPSSAGWAKYMAWHPTSISSWPSAKSALVVSDTGSILKQLNIGGDVFGVGDPAKVKAWVQDGIQRGYSIVGYYGFNQSTVDMSVMAACGTSGSSVDPTPIPTPEGDIDLSAAKWYGPNGAKAAVTETLTDMRIDNSKISYTLSKGTEAWEPHAGDKNCNQYACFFVYRGNQFQGGKFDWSTYSRKTRELTNIRNKYTGGIVPASGEDTWFLFMDLNGTKRSNAQKVKWP